MLGPVQVRLLPGMAWKQIVRNAWPALCNTAFWARCMFSTTLMLGKVLLCSYSPLFWALWKMLLYQTSLNMIESMVEAHMNRGCQQQQLKLSPETPVLMLLLHCSPCLCAAAIAAAVGAVPSADGRLPLHSSLRFADSQTAGCDTLNILSMKLKANKCANTTQGIHITGMDPPYAGSMTSAVLLLLMLGYLLLVHCWSSVCSSCALSNGRKLRG